MLQGRTGIVNDSRAGARPIAGALLLLLAAAWLGGCGERDGAAHVGDEGEAARHARVLAEGLPRVDRAALERIVQRTAEENRVLVLDFWATWCGACVAIFDDVHQRITALGEGARLVTVTLDGSQEETRAINFLAEHHALDDAYMLRPDNATRGEVDRHFGERWRALAVPAILVFDTEGELAREFIGEDAEPEQIAQYVERMRPG